MIKPEGRGFNSHPGQSFPLSLCGRNSICRANAHMVYGLKHRHFTLHSITPLVTQSEETIRTKEQPRNENDLEPSTTVAGKLETTKTQLNMHNDQVFVSVSDSPHQPKNFIDLRQ